MTRQPPLSLTIAIFALAFLVPAWPWLSGAVTIPYDAKSTFFPPVEFMARAFASRRLAVLDAERVRRLAEHRRPAVDAHLATASAARAREPGARHVGERCVDLCVSLPRRARHHPVFPRPRLAHGGRTRRGPRLRVRRRRERAAAAHRAGDEPRVSADRAVAAVARARPRVMALGRSRGRRGGADRARARSGCAARSLCARRVRIRALVRDRLAHAAARQASCRWSRAASRAL